ncbi:MAG: polyprenyl synthetase family protein [Bacteroidales bacterium]|nr:polyprenyl synthetase family protein [Bacteroidales bacterium]
MEKIQQLQQEMAAFIASADFGGQPEGLYAPVAYTVLQKGKRLRPMLCLLACDLFGGDVEEAKYPALALETAHNFTLIHDDIMDQAPLRRGMETVYKKWDTNTAILSGDAALIRAFEFVMRTPKAKETTALLVKVLREVCEGQQYDLEFERREQVSIPEYMEMIRLKTAVLLATSLQMGAVIAGAGEEDQRHLYDFGIAHGLAFQLRDDILDCYSDVSVFGKVTGGDIVENKKTYLYLRALELAGPSDRERLLSLFSGCEPIDPQAKVAAVLSIYDRIGIQRATESVIEDYERQASACLDAIRIPDERKRHLRHYVALLSGREK